MRLLPLALLAVTLTACGSGNPASAPSQPAPTTSATAISASAPAASPTGESDQCLVAATKWADRMGSHVSDAAYSVTIGPARTLNLKDTDDVSSTAKALCSNTISLPMLKGNYDASLLNAYLQICGSVCKGSAAAEVNKDLKKVQADLAKVQAQLN